MIVSLEIGSRYYSSIFHVRGGWLPVSPDILREASNIYLVSDVSRDEYLFNMKFPKERFKNLNTYLEKRCQYKEVISCLSKKNEHWACRIVSGNPKSLVTYKILHNEEPRGGSESSFWVLNEQKSEVILGNFPPFRQIFLPYKYFFLKEGSIPSLFYLFLYTALLYVAYILSSALAPN